MTRTPRTRRALAPILAATLALLVAANAPLAADPLADATTRVQGLIDAGDWRAATRELRGAEALCADADDSTRCRAVLRFTWGYLCQRWAEADTARRAMLLERSARNYAEARDLAPTSEQIWRNECVVRADLGDWTFLSRALDEAAERWPHRRVSHLVMYGDLYAAAGKLAAARGHLRAARDLAPGDETVLRSLLAVQRADSTVTAIVLVRQARELGERALWGPATESLELAIARAHRNDSSLADRALAHWADVRTTANNLTPASLRALPDTTTWTSAARIDLERLVVDPTARPPGRWWGRSADRRDIAAGVLLLAARRLRAAGLSDDAVTVLQHARAFGPPLEHHEPRPLAGRRQTALDVALELCVLYNELGRDDAFGALENQLFNRKSDAYARGDLAAIQRFHTVLALVYVDREQLTSDWADNAVFQLEHALSTAARREHQEPGLLQPLPSLRVQLADTYLALADRTSPPTARRRRDQAAGALRDAARDFLDLDRLDAAARMLDRHDAVDVPTDAERAREVAALRSLVAGRREAARDDAIDWRLAGDEAPSPPATPSWLAGDDLGLDAAFVQRQRFKAYSDLARRAEAGGDVATACYLRSAALAVLDDDARLASPRDEARLEAIERSLASEVRFREHRGLVDKRTAASGAGDRVLHVPGRDGAERVTIASDLVLASEILRDPRICSSLRDDRLDLEIADGEVVVGTTAQLDAQLDAAVESLHGNARVRELRRRLR